ncbi:hypothetical protein BDR04DRAFT_1121776 [Suillus decipiens]|nr:hypothetical protein BDR04DRAFT_1121776 [Suillus decipiens]
MQTDNSDDEESIPASPVPIHASLPSPVTILPALPAPALCRSTHAWVLTEGSRALADDIAASKAHLLELHEGQTAHIAAHAPIEGVFPNYNLKIPLATYNEAMQCPDHDDWLSAMKKELAIMKEICKAIGNCWVLEFKADNKGGPIHKGATFVPVLKTASLHLITAIACKNNWDLDSFDA